MLNAVQATDQVFLEQKAYQQALSDFGVEDFSDKISNYCDADFDAGQMHLELSEVETLAALLIQHFINSVNGKVLGGFLNALRQGDSEIFPCVSEEIQFPDSGLPKNFPDGENPHFTEGKKVRWKSSINSQDWGIILGRFYAYAPHLCKWNWKYVVLFNKTSPSSAWVTSDTAWEQDLEEV